MTQFKNFKYEINFVSKVDQKPWPHYLWSVKINGELFTYKTGLGHAVKSDTYFLKKSDQDQYRGRLIKIYSTKHCLEYAIEPKIENILNSLFLDSEANCMSFQNWCSEFGYNTDSIKDSQIYQECCKIDSQVRRVLGPDYQKIKEYIESLEL
jgi:hypothetical protein